MKKFILFASLIACSFLFSSYETAKAHAAASSVVYICTGSKSECYHSTPDCRGLNKCSGSIQRITLEQAKQKGRRPCKICCQ